MSVESPSAPAGGHRSSAPLEVHLFVDGAWRAGRGGWLAIEDPAAARSAPAGRVAVADAQDARDAIAAAQAAFPGWAATTAGERGELLKRAAALLTERAADVAAVLGREGGKTGAEALGEIGRAAQTLAWNGEQAGRVEGRLIAGTTPGSERLSVPTPVGVVAAFTAWNFPAVLATRKLGAILASGCTAVLKAAEATPGTAAEVVRALADAGAPAGVVNLLFSDDPATMAAQLIDAPEVRAITFTGSTAVGRLIGARAGAGLKRTVLELGGHAPVIVDGDADVALAVAATLPATFGSAGQSCVAPSRFLVLTERFDEFVGAFTAAAAALEPGVTLGPVIDAGRLAAMERLTADALRRGATLGCGGARVDRDGHFFAPTVLVDVPADAEIMREEPFGPVAVVNRVADLDAAIREANATEYAFAAYVFTDSLRTRRRILAELRATNVGINQMAPSLPDAPLGGMQASGLGYEGGRDGIAAFQHLRLISQTAAAR